MVTTLSTSCNCRSQTWLVFIFCYWYKLSITIIIQVFPFLKCVYVFLAPLFIQEPVENGEVALGAFVDSEGAFYSTSFDIKTKVTKRHGLGETTCWWIHSMLGSRKIVAMLAGETPEGFVSKGCLQVRHAVTSAVEPGCGQTHKNTRWESLLYTGICRWHCHPNQRKILQKPSQSFQIIYSMHFESVFSFNISTKCT